MRLLPRALRWSAFRLRTKGLIVVALPVVPLAVFWSLTAVTLVKRGAPINTAGSYLEVQAGLARVFSGLLDADAGARDYVLTEDAAAFGRYEDALRRLPADLAALDEMIADPELRASFARLQEEVTGEVIVLRRIAIGQPPAEPWIPERTALDRSLENLETIRALTASMQDRQAAIAVARAYRTEIAGTVLAWLLLIGSVLCAGGGIATAIVVAGSLSRRINILSRNADRLAQGQAIHSPPLGEDEIGQLDCRFREAARLLSTREAELRARTYELEAANRELEAFGYSVSHDLRAPLRAIDGFSEQLESEYLPRLDEGGRDALRRVRKAAQRMGTLIDELLNLSRLTRAELKRETLDLSGLATSIIADLVRHHPDRHVDVRVEAGVTTEADPHLVRIALYNLLDNAWKYTSKTASARIDIGSRLDGTARVYSVRDNGAGFDMKYAARIFDAFQRLHAERDFPGTGIGLAIVQRIVHRHGGRIWVESAPGEGAAVHFTLAPEVAEGA